jgi:hypothetical protein
VHDSPVQQSALFLHRLPDVLHTTVAANDNSELVQAFESSHALVCIFIVLPILQFSSAQS